MTLCFIVCDAGRVGRRLMRRLAKRKHRVHMRHGDPHGVGREVPLR